MTLFYYKYHDGFHLSMLQQQEMARNALSFPGSVPALGVVLTLLLLLLLPLRPLAARHDYYNALRKSILFFEGQRSGRLPPDQRVRWRKDSALHDGATAGVSFSIYTFPRLSIPAFPIFSVLTPGVRFTFDRWT